MIKHARATACLVLALVAGCAPAPDISATAPAATLAPGTDGGVLPTTSQQLEIQGVTRGALLAVDGVSGALYVSPDRALAWQRIDDPGPFGRFRGADGVFAALREGEAGTEVLLVRPGAAPVRLPIPADVELAQAVPTLLIDGAGRVADPRATPLVWRPVDFGSPTTPGLGADFALNAQGTLALRRVPSPSGVALALVPVDGSRPAVALDVPAAGSEVRVVRDGVRYTQQTASGWQLCALDLAGVTSCRALPASKDEPQLVPGGASADFLVPDERPEEDERWSIPRRDTITMLAPDGSSRSLGYPAGSWFTLPRNEDGERPILTIRTEAGNSTYAVTGDGGVELLGPNPQVSAVPSVLQLTPGGLLGLDGRPGGIAPGGQVWSRSLLADHLGADAPLAGRSSSLAASTTWAFTHLQGSPVQVSDAGRPVRQLTDLEPIVTTQASGPYAHAYFEGDARPYAVFDVTGRVVSRRQTFALFGSLALEDAPGGGLVVRDLAGGADPVAVAVGPASRTQLRHLWGDWVVGTILTENGSGVAELLAYNYRTQTLRRQPRSAEVRLVGDGYAVVCGPDACERWDLIADTFTPLRVTASQPMADDGVGTLVWADDQRLHVERFPTSGAAPRLLGALATPSGPGWRFDLDATRPLAAGSLVLTASGRVVRTLPTPAAPAGALHGLTWDGTDGEGVPVRPGTYRAEWRAAALDGSGVLVSVTGSRPASVRFTVG